MRRDASGGVKQLRGGLPFPSLRTRSRTFLRSPSLCRCSPVTLYAASSASLAATNRASCCSQRPRRQSSTSYMGRVYRLGSLHLSPRDAPHHLAFFEELRRLGFVEGQNLVVDSQGYNLRIEQLPEHAVELVKAQVDVIVCGGDVATHAAQRAKATIPILAVTDDMVGQGLVRSLVQPGGNTTGVSILAAELDGKRQEILMEGVPGIRRIAALYDSNIIAPRRLQALQDAARARGIEFSFHGGRHARTDRPGH